MMSMRIILNQQKKSDELSAEVDDDNNVGVNTKLIDRAACVRCHGTKCPLLTLSLDFFSFFSSEKQNKKCLDRLKLREFFLTPLKPLAATNVC
jgi:hypothetical protein